MHCYGSWQSWRETITMLPGAAPSGLWLDGAILPTRPYSLICFKSGVGLVLREADGSIGSRDRGSCLGWI